MFAINGLFYLFIYLTSVWQRAHTKFNATVKLNTTIINTDVAIVVIAAVGDNICYLCGS